MPLIWLCSEHAKEDQPQLSNLFCKPRHTGLQQ
jgi:hypothetical protein